MFYLLIDTDGYIQVATNSMEAATANLSDDLTLVTLDSEVDISLKRYVDSELVALPDDNSEVLNSRRVERAIIFSTTLDLMNPIWYDSLTDDEQTALAAWRTAWLDYPATGTRPDDLDIFN